MAFLGRLIVIVFAVIVASMAAGVAIALGLLGPEWHGVSGDVAERAIFWLLVFVGASFAGAVSLLPLAILIAVAETFKIRSLLANALAGAVMLMIGYHLSSFPNRYEESIDRPPPVSHETELAAAAGAVFGLVYWVIAGRNAGRWREPRT